MGRGDANPVWDNWVKNEFLTAMRAKGKLPALVGEARYASIWQKRTIGMQAMSFRQ